MEELIDLVNSVIILISNDLTQMLNFATRTPKYDSQRPTFLGLFLSSDTSICSTMTSLTLVNFDHVVVSVSIDFPSKSKQDMLRFIA